MAALRDLTHVDVLSAVGVREIAQRAGTSTGALYREFGSLAGLADAVVARVYDPDRSQANAPVGLVEQLRRSTLPTDGALALHRAEFDRVTTDPEFTLRMGLWAFGGPAVAPVFAHFLRTIDQRIAAFVGELFDSWGREVRPPIDLGSIVAAHVALGNGLNVRHRVDPGVLDRERFARLATSLSYAVLRLQGDRRTLDDRLAEINYYPGDAKRTAPLSDRRRASRTRLLDAAAHLFGRDSVEEVTMAQLARAAGMSASTAYDLLAGPAEVATALFVDQLDSQVAAAVYAEAPADLTELLTQIGEFARVRSSFVAPYLGALTTGQLPSDDPALSAVTEALRSLEVGEPEDLAIDILATVIGRVIRRPSAGVGPAVRAALRLTSGH